MGHNYAGVNRKKRLRRRKKEETRLEAWAKKVKEDWDKLLDGIWMGEVTVSGKRGWHTIFSINKPEDGANIKYFDLPKPMKYFDAIDYLTGSKSV